MRCVGTVVRGIRTGVIKRGDNLEKIVVDSVMNASSNDNFEIRDKDHNRISPYEYINLPIYENN